MDHLLDVAERPNEHLFPVVEVVYPQRLLGRRDLGEVRPRIDKLVYQGVQDEVGEVVQPLLHELLPLAEVGELGVRRKDDGTDHDRHGHERVRVDERPPGGST